MYNSTFTLSEIAATSPNIVKDLMKKLGKTEADDEPIRLADLLDTYVKTDHNHIFMALCAPSLERLSRHFAAWNGESVLYLFEARFPKDLRIRKHIESLYDDDLTPEQREAAQKEAWGAVEDADAIGLRRQIELVDRFVPDYSYDIARNAARAGATYHGCAAARSASWAYSSVAEMSPMMKAFEILRQGVTMIQYAQLRNMIGE